MFKLAFFVLAAALCAPVQASPVAVDERQLGCADVTAIFARGTTETPTLGTVIGPGLWTALATAIAPKTLSFQGVPYAADIPGFLVGGDPIGSAAMASMAASAKASCPNTKIVLSGYSQGAQLVHNSVKIMSTATASSVAAVVMFGDPYNGDALGKGLDSKSKTYCNFGDNICDGGALVLPAHLTYGVNIPGAASFIAGKV
ncbi:cutinase [Flagelloscypha sp. PMI_526]|nr:cutinase [Flagelloscypha sp. PMI_526]